MITRVRIKNYRSLADVDVTLGPLTVLVGRNGAGKSTFLDALRFIYDAIQSDINTTVAKRDGLSTIMHRSGANQSSDITFTLNGELDEQQFEYSCTLSAADDDTLIVEKESYLAGPVDSEMLLAYSYAGGKVKLNENNSINDIDRVHGEAVANLILSQDKRRQRLPISYLDVFGGAFSSVSTFAHVLYRFWFYPFSDLRLLREAQKLRQDAQLIEDGTNLVAVINRLMTIGYEDRVVALLKAVVDDVCGVKVQEAGEYKIIKIVHQKANGQCAEFDLTQESDGTVRFLAILAALYGGAENSVICIEEPEMMLYPNALSVLAEVLKEASLESQVIITTQSPDFISRFDTADLRIVERIDGATRIGPIDERQASIIHDELFTTGDLLRVEGLHRAPDAIDEAADA